MEKAVVLLSGGMDSATVLYIAKARGFALYTLTFNYGQKNIFEIEAAEKLSELAGAAAHRTMEIDLGAFGGSTLTSGKGLAGGRKVPDTYVPGRNTVFLSIGLAWAEAEVAGVVFFGANVVDFSGYPDCTHEFIEAFNNLAKIGLSSPVRIEAPVLNMSKREIASAGKTLGVDYSMTNSCYFPDETGSHCGECRSCVLRTEALKDD